MNNETAKLKGQFVTTQLRAALDGLTAAERLRVTQSEKAMSLFVESAMKGARVVQVEIKHYNRSDLSTSLLGSRSEVCLAAPAECHSPRDEMGADPGVLEAVRDLAG